MYIKYTSIVVKSTKKNIYLSPFNSLTINVPLT